MKHIASIVNVGLSKMSREYIHMVPVQDTDAGRSTEWSMARQDIDLYVFVDVCKAKQDGMEFHISDNGVVLSAGLSGIIPPSYLTLVPAYNRDYGKSGCYGFLVRSLKENMILMVYTPKGHAGFPKGKRNKGEQYMACALRELYEETGLKYSDITILEGCVAEKTDRGNVSVTYYYATVLEIKPVSCRDPTELSKVMWHTKDEIEAMPPTVLSPNRLAIGREYM